MNRDYYKYAGKFRRVFSRKYFLSRMKFALCFLALCLGVAAAMEVDLLQGQWNSFKMMHNKTYKSADEEAARFAIFKMNLNKINKHNEEAQKGLHTFTLRMNKFGDLVSSFQFNLNILDLFFIRMCLERMKCFRF